MSGVQNLTVSEDEGEQRLDRWMKRRFPQVTQGAVEKMCRTGQLRVLRAEDGILHYQRVGKVETAEIIVNRTEHIIVETLASGKSTEVNPMGFTIVVEEVGHNPNHSYYDYV